FFFFQAEDGIRDWSVTGVQTCALPILPVGWTVFNAMLLYNITVKTGKFEIVRRSVASLSGDARLQAVLIGFAFGAFLEGAAGARSEERRVGKGWRCGWGQWV